MTPALQMTRLEWLAFAQRMDEHTAQRERQNTQPTQSVAFPWANTQPNETAVDEEQEGSSLW